MANYRKKPIVIEAWRFDGSSTSFNVITEWMETGVYQRPSITTCDIGRILEIPTLEGVMTASAGDYIIKGINGEFYPCKPNIFKTTYERTDDDC